MRPVLLGLHCFLTGKLVNLDSCQLVAGPLLYCAPVRVFLIDFVLNSLPVLLFALEVVSLQLISKSL